MALRIVLGVLGAGLVVVVIDAAIQAPMADSIVQQLRQDYRTAMAWYRKGMALDLGSTSKGYAADEILKLIRAAGVKKAVIDLGGNVLVEGSRPDGKPWRIGLQDPFAAQRGAYLGIASLTSMTMVTSGVYERFFIEDGKRYHHILDTRTGYPVDNNLSSVTIVSDNSKQGDGLAATCFLLGVDKATLLVESLTDTQAIFITKDGQTITTKGIGDRVKFVPSVPNVPTAVPNAPTGETAPLK